MPSPSPEHFLVLFLVSSCHWRVSARSAWQTIGAGVGFRGGGAVGWPCLIRLSRLNAPTALRGRWSKKNREVGKIEVWRTCLLEPGSGNSIELFQSILWPLEKIMGKRFDRMGPYQISKDFPEKVVPIVHTKFTTFDQSRQQHQSCKQSQSHWHSCSSHW